MPLSNIAAFGAAFDRSSGIFTPAFPFQLSGLSFDPDRAFEYDVL